MFGGRISLVRYSKHFINLRHGRSFCNNNKNLQNHQYNSVNGGTNIAKYSEKRDLDRLDAYRELDDLNFTKAAKILLSAPKKKFGFDFHMVQLFFALMPSLAVYLVALYSRYEMRKMNAKLDLEKKAEEEKKAKEMAAAAADEKEPETDPELLKVKERLEALEETIKKIAKKQSRDDKSKTADQGQTRVDPNSRPDAVETKKQSSDDKSKSADQGQMRVDPNSRPEDK